MITLFVFALIALALYLGFKAGYHWRGRPSNGTFTQRWLYLYEQERRSLGIFSAWRK